MKTTLEGYIGTLKEVLFAFNDISVYSAY